MDLKELLLSDFPLVSDQEWKEKVVKDLRGKEFDDTLIWKDENGINHKPYYRKSDIEKIENLESIQVSQRNDKDWEILENKPLITDPLKNAVKTNLANGLDLTGNSKLDFTIYKTKGASILTELSLALHHVLEYVDAKTSEGNNPDKVFKELEYHFAFGNSYFLEIAKGRAFRFLISKLQSAYKVKSHSIIIGHGSQYYLADKDAHTNLLRTTTQAMSAVLGGCNSVFIPAFDEFGNKCELGKRMARNIQLILKEESYFGNVIDAASGSYYIESLTNELCIKAWDLFVEIEEEGGLIAILNSGKLKRLLIKDREARIKTYDSEGRVLLGVNKFKNGNGVELNVSSDVELLAREVKS